jgi:hypothetical protein
MGAQGAPPSGRPAMKTNTNCRYCGTEISYPHRVACKECGPQHRKLYARRHAHQYYKVHKAKKDAQHYSWRNRNPERWREIVRRSHQKQKAARAVPSVA